MNNDFDRAIDDLTNAIRLDPKCNGAFYYRCLAFAARKDFDKALADADEAIVLDPSDADLYRVRGSIYEAKGDKTRSNRDFDRCRDLALAVLQRELDLTPENKEGPAIDNSLELRIRHQVESLGYGDSVQRSAVALVRSWNLTALEHQLDAAMSDYKHQKLSAAKRMEVQQKVAENLARMINTVIWPIDHKTGGHELTEVVQDRIGCCQGVGLLYYVLGNAIGLSVEGLDVELMADGPSPDGIGHIACVVKMSDDSLIMVDATKQVGHHGFTSQRFRLNENFRAIGTYWELRDKSNPLGLHQVIQIIDVNGLTALLNVNRAIDLANKGDLSGAKRYCTEALRLNSQSDGGYFGKGFIDAKLGHFGDAVTSFSDAILRDPSLSVGYSWRGWCYDKLGKFDSAFADYYKALSLNSTQTLALTSRSRWYISAGNFERALKDANSALKTKPNYAEIYQLRAEIWAGMASHESEALAITCGELSRQYAAASDNAAISQGAGEKINGADQESNEWEKAGYSTNPNLFGTPTVHDAEALASDAAQHASARMEDYKHVVADLDEVIRLDPKATWVFTTRGAVCAYLRDFDKAIADCSEAIRLDPKNIKLATHARRAVYETKGDLDKAIADLSAIIRLDPKSANAYKARADLYAGKYEINKAAADYAEAERLKPSDDRYR